MVIYMAIIAITLMSGLVLTIVIGNSQKNREGDPTYDRNPVRKMVSLSSYYVLMTFVIVVGMVVYYFSL